MTFINACRQKGTLLLGVVLQLAGTAGVWALPDIKSIRDLSPPGGDAENDAFNLMGDAQRQFVQTQFENFQSATNCTAFVASFKEDQFKYCDGLSCITKSDDLLKSCSSWQGSMAGEVMSLDIKPLRVPPWGDYFKIVATGRQNLDLGEAQGLFCFDFAIEEELERMEDGSIKSTLWNGYYTFSIGDCRGGLLFTIWNFIRRLFRRKRETKEDL